METNASETQDLSGTQIGRYLIRSRVGSGGMGEVYLAEDTRLRRKVALKRVAPRLRNDPQYRQYLLNEARRASAFNDPRIAAIYDILDHETELFVVMEYVDGFTLRERMKRPISADEFMTIAIQCAEGLKSAHEIKIIHGDLKPENVMVLRRSGEVKICDFGLAHRSPDAKVESEISTQLDDDRGVRGTPAYVAPEVLMGKAATPSTDIFSMGIVFYEILSGQHPFRADNMMRTAGRILSETPPAVSEVNPAVSPAITKIVSKMLEKEPERRYTTAAELLADLRAVAAPHSGTRHSSLLLGAVSTLMLALAISVGALWIRLPNNTPRQLPAKNLVVIPFEAIGQNPQQQSLATGLSETLNAMLVKLTVGRRLQVSPASDVQLRRVKNATDARKELGAHLVLTGTVQFSGRLIRVNCVLIDGPTNAQIRADTITAEMGNLFFMQDRIVESVVQMLNIQLNPADQMALMQHGTVEPGAYEFYLQGRGYAANYDKPENLDTAIQLFQRALETDAQYALAYSGLGEAYWRKFDATKDKQWVTSAGDACQRAASLGRNLAASHSCLGTVYNGTGNYAQAVSEFSKTIELEPTSDTAYVGLASAYERLGQGENAERTYRRAIELRPQYWASYSYLGAYYFKNSKYDAAREMFQQVVRLAPDSFRGYSNLGAMYFMQDQDTAAIEALEKSLSIRPQYSAAVNLGTVYFYQGNYEGAAGAYRRALSLDDRDYTAWANLGAAQEWTKDLNGSRQSYERALALAEVRLKVNPRNAKVLMDLARYNGELGSKDYALGFLQQALAISPDDPALMFNAAVLFEHNLQRRDDAFLWLEKAIKKGYAAKEIDRGPSLKELRKDPRFAQLRNQR